MIDTDISKEEASEMTSIAQRRSLSWKRSEIQLYSLPGVPEKEECPRFIYCS